MLDILRVSDPGADSRSEIVDEGEEIGTPHTVRDDDPAARQVLELRIDPDFRPRADDAANDNRASARIARESAAAPLSSDAKLVPPRRLSASCRRSVPTISRLRVCARPVNNMLGTPFDIQASPSFCSPMRANGMTAIAGRGDIAAAGVTAGRAIRHVNPAAAVNAMSNTAAAARLMVASNAARLFADAASSADRTSSAC